jgi:hypothetical protein
VRATLGEKEEVSVRGSRKFWVIASVRERSGSAAGASGLPLASTSIFGEVLTCACLVACYML